jgi:hypothetical protein
MDTQRRVSVVSNATPTIDALAYAQYNATAQQSARDVVSTQDARATAEQYSAARQLFIERQESISLTQGARAIVLQSIAISLTLTAAPIVYSQTVAGATATAQELAESRAHTLTMNTQAEQDAVERGKLINGAITILAGLVAFGVATWFLVGSFALYERTHTTPALIEAKGKAALAEAQAWEIYEKRRDVLTGQAPRQLDEAELTPAIRLAQFVDLCIARYGDRYPKIPNHTKLLSETGNAMGGGYWQKSVDTLTALGIVYADNNGTHIKLDERSLGGVRHEIARRADEIDALKQ